MNFSHCILLVCCIVSTGIIINIGFILVDPEWYLINRVTLASPVTITSVVAGNIIFWSARYIFGSSDDD